MKRQYSFKSESQNEKQYHRNENKQKLEPCYIKTKQNMDILTDKKIDEIKKKYDILYNKKYLLNNLNYQKSKPYSIKNINNLSILYEKKQLNNNNEQNQTKKQYKLSNYYKKHNNQNITNKQNLQNSQPIIQLNQYYKKQNNIFSYQFNSHKQQKSIHKQYHQFQQFQTRNIDPRLHNIDRINFKIKNFLNCLQSNQKNKSTIQHVVPNAPHQSQKILPAQKRQHKSEQLNPIQFSPQKNRSVYHEQASKLKQKQASKQKQQQKYQNKKKLQQQIKQNSKNIQQKITQKNNKNQYKIYLQKNNKQHIKQNKHQSIQLNKLNDQINKINQRIKQYQVQKKQLNIEFIPYHYQQKNHKNHHINKNQPTNLKLKNKYLQCTPTYEKQQSNNKTVSIKQNSSQPINTMDKITNFSCQMPLNSINSFTFKTDSLDNLKFQQKSQEFCIPEFSQKSKSQCQQIVQVNNQDISSDKIQQQQIKQDKQNKQHKQNKQDKQDKQGKQDKQDKQNKQDNQDKQNKQDKQDKQEKQDNQVSNQLLSTVTITFSKQTKQLISNLFEQVKLDQSLRNAKIWYNDLQSPTKLSQLLKQAQSLGIALNETQLKVTQQQDNPFYTSSQLQQSYHILLTSLRKSTNYWLQNIVHNFDIHKLQQQQFTCQKVDLQKKGFLLVEDLVRFLNMQTGTFYRNRDLILIFRRLSKQHQLKWQQFLEILNKNI